MISALAQTYQAFGDDRYLTAARRAADFIFDRRYDHDSQSLFRCRVDSDPEILGIADDHLFFVQALLDKTVALFYDADAGGFFMTRRNTMAQKTIVAGLTRMQAHLEALTVMRIAALHAEGPPGSGDDRRATRGCRYGGHGRRGPHTPHLKPCPGRGEQRCGPPAPGR